MDKLLHIKGLSLSIASGTDNLTILDDITFDIAAGEKIGLIGESGSGKSMLARAILGLNTQVKQLEQSGQILWQNAAKPIDLISPSTDLSHIRRNEIGIAFQQSAQIFNPGQQIGPQLLEKVSLNKGGTKSVMEGLEEVELMPADRFYMAYPHQLSGGQLQRALIAMALLNEPKLLIADEPLSALDSDTEKQILQLLTRIVSERSTALLIISHDLGQVFDLCDRIVVLEHGRVVEQGTLDHIINNPNSDLTRAFESSKNATKQSPSGLKKQDVLVKFEEVSLSYQNKSSFFGKDKKALAVLNRFSLDIYKGEVLGLYGKSGSGKSSLARLFLKLEDLDSGAIYFHGQDIWSFDKSQMAQFRRQAQIIFQDPLSAMSPHRTVRQHFADASSAIDGKLSKEKLNACLERVGLVSAYADRVPKQLSGGERQRVLIARALYMEVEFLICDEILASLDELVSKEILSLLSRLVHEQGLTLLFISHDLEVLEQLCHRIVSLDS